MKRQFLLGSSLVCLLSACGTEEEATPTPTATPAADVLDLRFEPPAPPEGGLQFIGPEVIVKPYEDKMACLFLKPTDVDLAVNLIQFYQGDYGHHAILVGTDLSEEEYPTNEVVDCSDPAIFPMSSLKTFILPISDEPLPEGFAALMPANARFVFQSHYVNTQDKPLLIQDVINFGVVPVESVTTWVNGWAHSLESIDIPSNAVGYSRTINCTFDTDLTIMNLLGHMHEWGSHITIDLNRLDGSTKRLYDYNWKPEFRDSPPIKLYEGTMTQVKAGESFTTTCTWFNDTDVTLSFPHEMCAASGMAYPLTDGITCSVKQ